MRSARRRNRAKTAGFTLTELMTVVAIMGILATLAVAGVRKHFNDAKSQEAIAMIQAIRAGQESRRTESGMYVNVSTGTAWYPAVPDGKVRSWSFSSHLDYPRWRQLGISRTEGTRFGYLVNAGPPGSAMTVPQTASAPTWPTPVDPWFVIQAAGDVDNDGTKMLVLASSINGELYVENGDE